MLRLNCTSFNAIAKEIALNVTSLWNNTSVEQPFEGIVIVNKVNSE